MKKGDIAVIGMAGRFPGAENVGEFWNNLVAGKDCATWLTDEALLDAGVAKADFGKDGYVRSAYLLDGYDTFDAEFFKVPPVDAEMMDPQIRLFLQCAWHALEDAGYGTMGPKNIGVFAGMGGVTTNYLASFINQYSNIEKVTASKTHTGNDKDFIANFISYKLNLTGPSVAVQTACSTSMVAVHQACSALLNDECEMCLAGGVNIRVPHAQGYEYKRGYIFSKSGRIRSFDASADGVVFGNGLGLVLLKSLDKAVRDGDPIYAVVKGTAVTNDGRDKVSYTATNVDGQYRCIERALGNAGIDPGTIGFVESHGTGTYMGDPMEISALTRAFGEARGKCALGAVKTGIGHLDVAAGITGFIKTVLTLHNRRIPPTLHFSKPNPRINFAETPFHINTALVEWSANGTPRRAGVNSVGVGGTNAFAVLEEYIPKARKQAKTEPRLKKAIVPLSARSPESLRRHAADLARFLEVRSGEGRAPDLADLAYTLQIGREAMACRCALVVESLDGLRKELALFLEGQTGTENGDSSEAGLAKQWMSGASIPWLELYGKEKPRRINLPGYCFETKRYWMDAQARILAATAEDVIHPLLQRNISDWEGQKYLSRFQGEEFFLAQHLVHGRKILPGAACLEMARAALATALPSSEDLGILRLSRIEWIKPIEVAGSTEVELELIEWEENHGPAGIGFQIRRPDQGGELAHCRGDAEFLAGETTPAVDAKTLPGRADSGKQEEIYKVFSGMGIGYGPAFQVLQSIHVGEDQLTARIALPACFPKGVEDFALHPALLDGAFQACTWMGLDPETLRKEPPLPFALESLTLYRPCPPEMFALVRHAPGSRRGDAVARFDADLVDASGTICVELRGFSFRYPDQAGSARRIEAADVKSVQSIYPRLQSMVPVWNRLSFDRPATEEAPEDLLTLHYPGSPLPGVPAGHSVSEVLSLDQAWSTEKIAEKLKPHASASLLWIAPPVAGGALPHDATMAAFRFIKALLALGHGGRELKLTVVIDRSHKVSREEAVLPAHGGIAGLVGSLAKEYPRWQIRLLDVDFTQPIAQSDVLSLPWSRGGDCFARRGGEWFAPGMAALEAIPSYPPAFRQKGVYVVIGGAGGLGMAWSRYLMDKYQADMVWIGRSPLSPAIEEKTRSLARNGKAPLYISADASDPESLAKAYRRIAETHPIIHGVVHAAIVLDDKTLGQMDEERFRNGFAAKADVALNMAKVFGALDLDFMLFFSSMQSFYKAPGQSNYAAGCTFQDALAHRLDEDLAFPVKIVNWGYWGNIGVVSNDFYKQRMAEQGIGSIEVGEGMDFLEAFMASGLRQAALVRALDAKAFRGLALSETLSLPAAIEAIPTGSATPFPEIQPREPALGLLEGGLTTTVMDELAAELLAETLSTLSGKELVPYFKPWLETSLKTLRDRGIPAPKPGKADALWKKWDKSRSAWLRHEEIRAHVELLETCLKALPDILTGARPATQVLFPESSLRRVQGVYSGNPVSDYYNDLMADVLAASLEAGLRLDPQRKFRILEIGAGTGGTTSRLIPKLGNLVGSLAEYRYTDLSKAFLIHAQERFAEALPALATSLFDITKPLRKQEIEAGGYDFVIATNVLHATSDVRDSLRNAKAALKPGGMLLLNEMSTWSLYSHLTFGLLEGWWLYQDPALRIDGSAALAPEGWLALLKEEGFTAAWTPAWEQRRLGQQIFLACSDGVLRQKGLKEDLLGSATPESKAAVRTTQGTSPSAPRQEQDLHRRCHDLLKRMVAETLRMDAGKIDLDSPLETYGLDSILILKFTDKLRETFSDITSTVFFEVQTIRALAEHLVRNNADELKAVAPETAGASKAGEPEAAAVPNRTQRMVRARRPMAALRAAPVQEPSSLGVDVAIIGLDGRYPKSPDLAAFWRNLAGGIDCISEIPRDRWKWEDWFDAEKGKSGKIYSKWGGFLEDIDKFDPLFFRISPKEAKRMDPQERLFLESAYHAMEDAGYTPAGLGKSEKIGVYAGVMNSRYSLQPYYFSIANRISYLFDFRGPSMAVDTACSSSLTAIHLAVESIVNGTCDCAIAGGVNLIIDPVHYLELSELTMLSGGSLCKSFGNKADGFVDAEGVGTVVLKSLQAAERDKDHIYAVIKGSAINAGGKTNGYTVPNPKAQAALVADAIARSGIPAGELGYIEAHGTGTALGDPIEISALGNAFRQGPEGTSKCRIGSVKSNIGHCESAAGIAGLTKVLLQLKHGKLAPSLHADEVNPEIDFAKTPFALQKRLEEWEPLRKDLPRAAGISSFGAGGANTHLIVQEYIARETGRGGIETGEVLLTLSARTQDQLRRKAEDLVGYLQRDAEGISLAAIAYTLQAGREAMGERLAVLAASKEEALEHLTAFLSGKTSSHRSFIGQAKSNKEFLASFREAPDSQAALAEHVAGKRLDKLAELWAKGVDLPWEKLYIAGTPARVSLPTYPFARERYWEIRTPHVPGSESQEREKILHPLVHRNTSTVRHLQFSSRFRGDEGFLTAEGSSPRFPTGACLEAARAALELAQIGKEGCIELSGIEWAGSRLPEGDLEWHIALWAEGEKEMGFEIFSTRDGEETILCQGRGQSIAASAPKHSIPASIGPGEGGSRWMRMEAPVAEDVDGLFLNPTLLEKVLDAAAASYAGDRHLAGSLESLRIHAPTASDMMAWIRPSRGSQEGDRSLRLDIDLCHPDGAVCAQLIGLECAMEGTIKPPAAELVMAETRTTTSSLPALELAGPALAIRLDNPLDLEAEASASSDKVRISLLDLAGPDIEPTLFKSSGAVSLSDLGDGIFAITMDAPEDRNRLTGNLIGELSALLQSLADRPAKVLILRGNGSWFLRGGAKAPELSLSLDLGRTLAAFPYPTIACMEGNADGAGWLLGALCDFMICSEEGTYRWSGAEEAYPVFQGLFEFYGKRFSTSSAAEFLGLEAAHSGTQLRGLGWSGRILPKDQVAASADSLAKELAGKPEKALRLLKQHLNREMLAMIRGFQAAPEVSRKPEESASWRKQPLAALELQARGEQGPGIDLEPAASLPAQAEPIALTSQVVRATAHPEGILFIEMVDREAKNQFSDRLIQGMMEVFDHIARNPRYKAAILTGYDAYFATGGTKESLLAIQAGTVRFTDQAITHLPLQCEIPVIAAVQGHAVGGGLSLAQFCDFTLFAEESKLVSPYMEYGFTPGAGATLVTPMVLGYDLGRESLLNSQEFEGTDLVRRGTGLPVFPRKQVVEQAFRLARALAEHGRSRLVTLKNRFSAEMRAALEETYRLELEMHGQTFVGQAEARERIGKNFSGQETSPTRTEQKAASPLSPGSILTAAAVRAAVGEMLAKELHLKVADVEEDKQFVDLGLDSIVGVTWVRKINQKYGTAIEAVRIYSYPNLQQFGDYIWEEAKRVMPEPPAPAPMAPPKPVEPVAKALTLTSIPSSQPRAASPGRKLSSIRTEAGRFQAPAQAGRGRSGAIAVIGMSGRFPKAKTLELFWKNIAEGRDCIEEIPASRWDTGKYFVEGSPKPGKTNCKWMGMLEDHDKFDPLFFNISPKEAIAMDPQQRVFLEACWHAVEYAGYNPGQLAGSRCGVFAGCSTGDYHQLSQEQKLSALGFTGGNSAILAARIAYFLDFLGPCLSIETACSSSLVAIATACDSLQAGTSDIALAGGVNVMAGPEVHIKTAQSNMLSAHGKCFTFDQRADGLVPGEGVGVVLLKRLADAERDGDCIYGVIEGWGINQDGKTNGITAPKAESQRSLIRETYEKFGIDPETIQMIEAHGTGTKLGDPIEVAALKDAFRNFTGKRDYCAIGSVKSNIGHTFTAAGVAGVLKCLWALKENKLPPTINFDHLNEHIQLEGSPFYVNTRLRDWASSPAAPRRAAVSSFGFSGTNCHLVIAEYRSKASRAASEPGARENGTLLFPLSARTKEQLDQAARDLSAFLSGGTRRDLADLAYTLQVGRKPMEYRLGLAASSREELRSALDAFLTGQADSEAFRSGKVAGKEDGIQVIGADEDLKATITLKWVKEGKPQKLLELWVRGVEIDWNLLHAGRKPKRTALPLYPFARQRYWIEANAEGTEASSHALPVSAIHPFLHRNISDLHKFAFESEFSGRETVLEAARFGISAGSGAGSEPGLDFIPASAQLEMMAAALSRIAGAEGAGHAMELRDIRWDGTRVLRPGARIMVELFDQGTDGLGIEIGGPEKDALFCQARGAVRQEAAAERRVDLAALRARMQPREKTGSLTSLHAGTDEILAGLRNAEPSRPWAKDLALDPFFLHQALACLGLHMLPAETFTGAWLPEGIDSLEIFAPFGKEMFFWIRKASDWESEQDRYDLDALDMQGKPAARLRGIRFVAGPRRPAKAVNGVAHANGHHILPAAAKESPSRHELEIALQASLAQALFLEPSDVDADTLFTDLGMDSIIGVEWVDALNKKLGSRLNGTVLYQYPTIKKLAEHLDQGSGVPITQAPHAPQIAESLPLVAAPSAPPAESHAPLRAELMAGLTLQLADALYLQAEDIDRETLFTDLGMDSIIGVEWVAAINKKHGTALPATALYQYPTITRLAAFLGEELAKSLPPAPVSAPSAQVVTRSLPSFHDPLPALAPEQSPLESFRKTSSSPARANAAPGGKKTRGIAVIGMAGQFPQAEDAEAFWRNIRDGRDCVTPVPENRWRDADFHQVGKPAQGKYYSHWMGAMDGVDLFDPLFFNISPTEAKSMDPQQRLFLQTCWHSMENAGYSAAALSESRCGVFVGASKGDYLHLSKEHELSSQGFTGGAISILAARASYFLNLLGPCVTIDTACSSALVAMASACDSLEAGTSDLALAGGVFIMSSPEMHIMTSQAGMLSTEGRCLAFDQRADGFVPADGVGMVVLKRLEDAEKDGDHILGIIEGWGVNQDGKTNGITAPNAASQTRLIQDVYERFGIDAGEIQLVEAHGTGTRLGDPIEIDALKKAFGKYTRKAGYCAVGTVKSNIGHALTAAGMAGAIKVLHALQKKKLPPTIHVREINRYIELEGSPFYINTELKDWNVPAGQIRRAAVSSFGFSGTNAHLVIAEYEAKREGGSTTLPRRADGKALIPLSAKTKEQLLRKAEDLLALLETADRTPDLESLAYTLQVGRDAMPCRLAMAADKIGDVAAALQAFIEGRPLPDILWEGKAGPEIRSGLPDTVPPGDPAEQQAREGRPEALIERWIRGGEMDWTRLYTGRKPKRLPLPGYPFAKQRFWIDRPYALASGPSAAQASSLHPLLQRNTSNLGGAGYGLTLSGEERFLKDHRLKLPGKDAQKLLPGAAYLEMARAAFSSALPEGTGGRTVALQDVVFMSPLFVEEGTEVTIALQGYEEGGEPGASFEITSHGRAGDILHCKGEARLVDEDAPAAVQLPALKARMQKGDAEQGEIYASFTRSGLLYGPSHRCIASLLLGDGEALARMVPASELEAVEMRDCMMPPNLLDGALQSSIGMLWRDKEKQAAPLVPFSMSDLTVFSSCEDASYAWVRRAKRKTGAGLELDIDLLDSRGRVCIRVEGFSFRELTPERAAERAARQAQPGDYDALLDQVMNKRISIEDAAELL